MNLHVLHDPKYVSDYAKNPHYYDMKGLDSNSLLFLLKTLGTPGFIDCALKYQYMKTGAQMRVSQEVSNELIDAKFDPHVTFEDIPWPKNVLELYFDDPLIPTFIIGKMRFIDMTKSFEKDYNLRPDLKRNPIPKIGGGTRVREPEEETFFGTFALKDGSAMSINLSKETWGAYIDGSLRTMLEDSAPVSKVDEEIGSSLCALALRVLAFASIPQAIAPPLTRKQMHTGGKAGVKGRPDRPNIRVVYLPRTYFEETKEFQRVDQPNKPKKHIEYREGHFRFFRHERFVNMRGKFIYVKPVGNPPPKIARKTFRVTKHST